MTTGPTVRRRRLAAELRQLREAAGMTLEDAAVASELSRSTLSRIENAQVSVKIPIARALMGVYAVDATVAEPLLALAREANQKGWWQRYSAAIESQFKAYLDFESEATEIRQFNVMIPGLLQTESYAREVLGAFHFDHHGALDTRVQLRMTRQRRLRQPDGPKAWFILDEAALRRGVGGSEVMRGQLEFLLDIVRNTGIRIQVVPFAAGAYPAMDTVFTILSFSVDPPVVYLENPASDLFFERAEEIDRFATIFDHLRASAASLRESAALIAHVLQETQRVEQP